MNIRFDVLYGLPVVKPHQLALMTTMDSEPTWNGVRVRISELCVIPRIAFDVVRNSRRRRRAYSVAQRYWTEPSAYRLQDGSLVMHPVLWDKLKKVQDIRLEPTPQGGS